MLPIVGYFKTSLELHGIAVWPKKWLTSTLPTLDCPVQVITWHSNGFVVWHKRDLMYAAARFVFRTAPWQVWRPSSREALEQAIAWANGRIGERGGPSDYREWASDIETIDDIINTELSE